MRVSEYISGLRHDLLGRIFHGVLDTARYDGSFYTSTAGAVLLATLALREEDSDWSDANAIANLRICDPACGTGHAAHGSRQSESGTCATLDGRGDQEDEEALDLMLVEDVLWGYDVNVTATHMAASTLGMLSPTTTFSRMNIHRALLGVVRRRSIPWVAGLPPRPSPARRMAILSSVKWKPNREVPAPTTSNGS